MQMQPNRIKEKLQRHEKVICMFQRIPDPLVTEMMCACGAELIVIDCEHFYHNPETIANIIRAAQIYGVSCLVRVCDPRPGVICNYLDMGAAGILLTDSEGVQDVRRAIRDMKYAPVGNRGVSTDSRACRFGLMLSGEEHSVYFNENTILAVVIESRGAVEELDEILKLNEVDIVSVGDGDLSYAYGYSGKPGCDEMIALRNGIYEKIAAAGKAALDKAFTPEAAQATCAKGRNVLYAGSDSSVFTEALRGLLEPIQQFVAGDELHE